MTRTFREECPGCGHRPHDAYECGELHLFTKKPCGCPTASRKDVAA